MHDEAQSGRALTPQGHEHAEESPQALFRADEPRGRFVHPPIEVRSDRLQDRPVEGGLGREVVEQPGIAEAGRLRDR